MVNSKSIKFKKLKFTFKSRSGIALIEVIAAFGIAVIVITSLVSLSLYTLRSTLNSKLQLQGTKVATREIELIRAYRDSITWSEFTNGMSSCTGSNSCCMDITGTTIYSSASPNCQDGTGLEVTKRQFTATVLSPTAMRISVTASWIIAGVTKYTHVYTDMTNWKEVVK